MHGSAAGETRSALAHCAGWLRVHRPGPGPGRRFKPQQPVLTVVCTNPDSARFSTLYGVKRSGSPDSTPGDGTAVERAMSPPPPAAGMTKVYAAPLKRERGQNSSPSAPARRGMMAYIYMRRVPCAHADVFCSASCGLYCGVHERSGPAGKHNPSQETAETVRQVGSSGDVALGSGALGAWSHGPAARRCLVYRGVTPIMVDAPPGSTSGELLESILEYVSGAREV
jgi:hypothetical protein